MKWLCHCAAAAALLGGPGLHAQDPPAPAPEYNIRQSEPSTGTLIRRNLMRGGGVPVNRKYHELTTEEKAIVHQMYEHIAPGDEPPFPAEGMAPVHIAINRLQNALRIRTGDMILIATVAPDGTVSKVEAYASPDRDMTKYSAQVIMLTKFKPAVCKGAPCQMEFAFRYSFGFR